MLAWTEEPQRSSGLCKHSIKTGDQKVSNNICIYFPLPSPPCNVVPLFELPIERFHSRGHHLCKFIGTKESVCIRKEFNSHGTGLGHQHGRRFIVLGHQCGRRDVMWKHSINTKHPNFEWRGQGTGVDSFVLWSYLIWVECPNDTVADCW